MSNTKTCMQCHQSLPSTASHFMRDKKSPDGLATLCKACNRQRCREYYAKHRAAQNARCRANAQKDRDRLLTAEREVMRLKHLIVAMMHCYDGEDYNGAHCAQTCPYWDSEGTPCEGEARIEREAHAVYLEVVGHE